MVDSVKRLLDVWRLRCGLRLYGVDVHSRASVASHTENRREDGAFCFLAIDFAERRKQTDVTIAGRKVPVFFSFKGSGEVVYLHDRGM